ncbi:hypothetical protein LCGC14_1425700 [marine sediment metagenome]|uniref:Uncharacterized protein n=1 Tax=marine sediment metagenome TaxID=412755 RepID=A0A0F9MRU4_9ZZZZ
MNLLNIQVSSLVYDRDKLIRAFCKKEKIFTKLNSPSHIILFFKHEGSGTPFKTHFSRGPHGRKVDDYLIEQMAMQLKLTKEQFLGIYDCKYYKNDYILFVKENLGPKDPLDLL